MIHKSINNNLCEYFKLYQEIISEYNLNQNVKKNISLRISLINTNTDSTHNDVANLNFLYLLVDDIKKKTKNQVSIEDIEFIYKNDDKKTPKNVAEFLSLIDKKLKKNVKTYKENFVRLLPLFKINKNTVEVFRTSVDDSLEELIGSEDLDFNFEDNSENKIHIIYSTSKEEFIDRLNKRIVSNSTNRSRLNALIWKICFNYLFHKMDYKKLTEGRRLYFSESDFYKKIKNMNLFSFLIMLLYDYVRVLDGQLELKEVRKGVNRKKVSNEDLKRYNLLPTSENINTAFFNALDMGASIIELLENIVIHSGDNAEEGEGYLTLRIRKKETSESYLKEKFGQYFAGCDNRRNGNNKSEEEQIEDFLNEHLAENDNFEIVKNYNNKARVYLNLVDKKSKREEMRAGGEYKHLLEIFVSDVSNKKLGDVFKKKNLALSSSSYKKNNFDLRFFLDPNKCAQEFWECYYNECESASDNVINHYGLQLFDAIIASHDGCYTVSNKWEATEEQYKFDYYSSSRDVVVEECTLPGTTYHILIPFNDGTEQYFSSVNTDIIYKKMNKEYSSLYFSQNETPSGVFDVLLPQNKVIVTSIMNDQYCRIVRYLTTKSKNKNVRIGNLERELSDLANHQINTNDYVMVFDYKEFHVSNIEVFCKAIFKFIFNTHKSNKNSDTQSFKVNPIRIFVMNCNEESIINIVRFFAIFYTKTGESEPMKNTQIYLSGENSTQEYLIAGSNLQNLISSTSKLSFSRRVSSNIINTLNDLLHRRVNNGTDTNVQQIKIDFFPFDLL